ncbi:MAG: DegT/DnrJ/EryC1/StrS family aminotransferase [Pirellulaceae bacterium]
MTASLPRAMKVPLVDLRAHHRPIEAKLAAAIQQVLEESSFIQGKHAAGFEREFANFLGVRHCVGTGNGTDALYIALAVLGVGPGDEVITVANSFIATSEAITRTGARVVFVDCDPATYTIDVKAVERAITPRTKAVIPVHLYGQPADMDPLMQLAERAGLHVVEDAAQAHGARYKGRMVGTLGHCACFSFYPGKNLGAVGDAGAVVTSDDTLAARVRMFANHGRKDKYDHEFEGVNSRLDGIQGAVLSVKLPHLTRWNDRRRAVARRYDRELRAICRTPMCHADRHHVYHLYVVRVERRDEVRAALQERGIEAGIHYPIPLPLLGAYKYLGHETRDFPVSCELKDQLLSLPIHGEMQDEEVEYVIQHLRDVLRQRRFASAA